MKKILILLLAFFSLERTGCKCVFAEDSTSYIRFNNEDGNIEFEGYKCDDSLQATFESFNFENYEFFHLDENVDVFFSIKTDNAEKELVLCLLQSGYIRIVDESIASQEEIDTQKNAIKLCLGGWKYENDIENINGEKTSEWKNKWNQIKIFIINNYQFILSVMAGCGLLAYIARKINKLLHTRKKEIFLGGANACGKTTLRNSIMNPDASFDDLLNQSPTLTIVKERIIRDDKNQKVSLSALIVDPPGHDLSYAIDCLSSVYEKLFHKYVLIIILAPCKGFNKEQAEYDKAYIYDQYETLKKLWIPLLRARSTITPEQVILFLNKKDLFLDEKEYDLNFKQHREILQQTCVKLGITFNIIKGSILKKAGMTELMRLVRR